MIAFILNQMAMHSYSCLPINIILFIYTLICLIFVILSLQFSELIKQLTIKLQISNKKNLHSELSLLTQRAQPHLISNLLSGIQLKIALGYKKEAMQAVALYNKYLRLVLSYTQKKNYTLFYELELIKQYIQLENTLFPHVEFDYSKVDKNAESAEIAPLMLQPLVENAIKHSFRKMVNGDLKLLFIETEVNENTLIIKVKNNDCSLDEENPIHYSYGLSNIESCLRIMDNLRGVTGSELIIYKEMHPKLNLRFTVSEVRINTKNPKPSTVTYFYN